MTVYSADHKHFSAAVQLAHFGEHRVRVGCVAVWKGKRVAGAFNTLRNVSPGVDYGDLTYHAEVNCILSVSPRIRRSCVLYIARIALNYDVLPSNPCQRCMALLVGEEVKGIVYMDDSLELVKRTV